MSAELPPELRERSLALVDRTLEVTGDVPDEVRRHDVLGETVAIAIFWRCTSLLAGVRAALHAGQPEAGFMVARSIFEESLWVGQLAAVEGTRRKEYAVGWFIEMFRRGESWLRERAQLEGPPLSAEELRAFRRQPNEMMVWAKRQGVEKSRPFGDAKKLARRQRRVGDYVLYSLAHTVVHGAHQAQKLFGQLGSDLVGLHARSHDPHLSVAAAVLGSRSCLAAYGAAAQVAGWSIDGEKVAAVRGDLDALDNAFPNPEPEGQDA